MSRADALSAELCSDGMVFKPIGKLASYVRRVTYSKNH